jgi:hypothetical protein
MPGEAIIGKVAVKVVPDTSNFKDDLKEQLEKIERSLGDLEVKIMPKLDDTEVRAEAKKAKEIAEKELSNVTLHVDLDNADSVRRNLSQLEAQLARLQETTEIEVDMQNMDDVLSAIDLLEEEGIGVELRVDETNPASIEAALKKLDAEIKAIADKAIEPIKLHLDEDELRAERERLQLELDHLNALEINVKFDLDAAEASRLKAEAEGVLKIIDDTLSGLTVGMKVDPAEVAKIKREMQAELLKLNDLVVRVDAELDPLAKRKLELEMEAVRARIHDLKVKLTPEVDQTAARVAAVELLTLARDRIVKLKPVVDNGATRGLLTALNRLSGHRQGLAWLTDIGEFLGSLDLALPRIAMLGTAFFGLAASVTAGSGALFVLAQQLATIASGAVLAGPGVLASIAASAVVATIAFKDFGKVLPDIKAKFGELKQLISDNFWAEAEKSFRSAFNFIFPQLKEGIGILSTSMGGFFSELALSLGEVLENNGRLKGMFQNVADGWDNLSGHAGAMARIIGFLGTAGSKFFKTLLTDLGNATEKWSDWLEEAEKTGRLDEIINNAYQSVINFFRVIGNIVQIFDALGDAARKAFGTDILGSFADGLDRIEKTMHGPVFQKEMSEVFVAAKTAMSEISDRAGPALGDAFKNLGNIVETIFPNVGATIGEVLGGIADAFNAERFLSGIQGFFGSIRDLAQTIRPAFDDMGDAIGSVLDLMSSFITASAPYARDALEFWSGVIETLADGLRPFVEKLVPAVGDLFNAIAPGIQKIADAIANFASGGGGDAIVKFVQDITPGAEKLAGFIGDLAKATADWLNQNLPDILQTWSEWFNKFSDWVDEHKDTIISFFTGLLDVVKFLATHIETFAIALGILVAVKIIGWLSSLAEFVKTLTTIRTVLGGGALATGLEGLAGSLGKFALLGGSIAVIAGLAAFIDRSEDWHPDNLQTAGDALFNLGAGASAAAGPLGLILDLLFGSDDGDPGLADYSGGGIPVVPPQNIPQDSNGRGAGDAPLMPQGSFPNLPGYVTPDQLDQAQKNWENFDKLYQGFIDGLIRRGDEGSDAIAGQFGDMFNSMQGHFNDAAPNLNQTWNQWWDQFEQKLSEDVGPETAKQLRDMLQGMQGQLDQWGPLFGDDWTNFWDGILTDQQDQGSQLPAQLGIQLASMQTNLGAFAPQFTTQFASMWQTANEIGGTQGDLMKQQLQAMLDGMNGQVSTGMTTINASWQTGWNQMPSGMTPGINASITLAGGIPGRIVTAVGPLGGTLYTAGAQLMQGLANGITSNIKLVVAAATLAANQAAGAVKSASKIASPSKVFAELGGYMMAGLAKGIKSNADSVVQVMTDMVADLTGVTDGYSGVSAAVSAAANRSMASPGDTYNSHKTLNYYAAPGSSISNEDDLFKAAARARMGW